MAGVRAGVRGHWGAWKIDHVTFRVFWVGDQGCNGMHAGALRRVLGCLGKSSLHFWGLLCEGPVMRAGKLLRVTGVPRE